MQSIRTRRLFAAAVLASPLLSPLSHASVSTPGEFRVNEMGAATYTIPLQVPPGVAGMEPKLALTYNSQAGNGLAGVGWSLAGLSSITRCPRTQAQDGARGTVNFDGNDRYCLDGQRLMLVSGTYGADGSEYRTELETFSKVVAHGTAGNGPAWFEVWNKDGRRVEYGNTADSRIEAQGKTTVAVWAMNRVEDRKGNYLTAGYIEDNANGQFYPSRMDWGGNSKAGTPYTSRVAFDYETRPDIVPYYQAGSLFSLRVRLTTVRAVEADNLVRSYNLTYLAQSGVKRSRLASVTECEAGGSCREPVVMTWASTDMSNFSKKSPPTALSKWDKTAGDFDGDGRVDLIPKASPVSSGSIGWSDWSVYSVDINGVISSKASGRVYADPDPAFSAADTNGDGSLDIIDVNKLESTTSAPGELIAFNSMDVNSDGKTEFVAEYQVKSDKGALTSCTLVTYFVANGTVTSKVSTNVMSLFGIPPLMAGSCPSYLGNGDFDGDGNRDLLFARSDGIYVGWGDGAGRITSPTNMGFSGWYRIGDFNGDGKTDLIVFNGGFSLWLSKGGRISFDKKAIVSPAGYSIDSNNSNYEVADFNGDGRSDLIHYYSSTTAYVWLSNGDGSFKVLPQITGLNNYSAAISYSILIGDYDGDGRDDLLQVQLNGANVISNFVWFAVPSNTADTLIQIGTGSGLTITPSYSSLAYRGCNRASGQSYPTVASCAPLYVVDQVAYSGMAASNHTVKYNYGGLTKRMDGRGLLGFAWMDATDVEHDSQRTRTVFNQSWPLTGTVASVTRYGNSVGNAGKLAETINSYTTVSLGNGRSFVGHTQSVSNSWDLNGTALPSTTVTRSYDCQSSTTCYGNLLTETSSSSDGYGKTVSSSYSNDSTSWLIGRVTQQTVSATTP